MTDPIVDKNKSAEQYIKEAESLYIVPALVREKFPDLVKLIYETESMEKEEREYWLQIMPIMSEDQIKKFRDILVNERDQLKKLEDQYQQEVSSAAKKPAAPAIDEQAMKKKLEEIRAAEKAQEESEIKKEEEILKQLGGI